MNAENEVLKFICIIFLKAYSKIFTVSDGEWGKNTSLVEENFLNFEVFILFLHKTFVCIEKIEYRLLVNLNKYFNTISNSQQT